MSEPRDLPRHLTRGTHLIREDGACLMELVSVLAGEPWTDTPKSTHPVLAHLAQLVNDAMTDVGRQSLRPIAPRLVGIGGDDARLAPAIAAACTRYALGIAPTLRLQAHDWYARRRLRQAHNEGGPRQRLGDRLYARGPARRAVEAAFDSLLRDLGSRQDPNGLDDGLRALLLAGMHAGEHVIDRTTYVT